MISAEIDSLTNCDSKTFFLCRKGFSAKHAFCRSTCNLRSTIVKFTSKFLSSWEKSYRQVDAFYCTFANGKELHYVQRL